VGLLIGDIAPNFVVDTTNGKIHFHEWAGGHWVLLVFHSADFEQELSKIVQIEDELRERRVKLLGLSTLPKVPRAKANYPIVIDSNFHISQLFSIASPVEVADVWGASSMMYMFIIGPDKRIRLTLVYPSNSAPAPREILRLFDSLQTKWEPGDDVILGDETSSVRILSGIDASTPRSIPPELLPILGNPKSH